MWQNSIWINSPQIQFTMDFKTESHYNFDINKNQNTDIKLHITFGTRGFFIRTTNTFKWFDYNKLRSLNYDIHRSCIRLELTTYPEYVKIPGSFELGVDERIHKFCIYCNTEDGNWFMNNYISNDDSSAELTLKQRICALEDKLKVLTEMMDKQGM